MAVEAAQICKKQLPWVSTVHCRVQKLVALQEKVLMVAWLAESVTAMQTLEGLRSQPELSGSVMVMTMGVVAQRQPRAQAGRWKVLVACAAKEQESVERALAHPASSNTHSSKRHIGYFDYATGNQPPLIPSAPPRRPLPAPSPPPNHSGCRSPPGLLPFGPLKKAAYWKAMISQLCFCVSRYQMGLWVQMNANQGRRCLAKRCLYMVQSSLRSILPLWLMSQALMKSWTSRVVTVRWPCPPISRVVSFSSSATSSRLSAPLLSLLYFSKMSSSRWLNSSSLICPSSACFRSPFDPKHPINDNHRPPTCRFAPAAAHCTEIVPSSSETARLRSRKCCSRLRQANCSWMRREGSWGVRRADCASRAGQSHLSLRWLSRQRRAAWWWQEPKQSWQRWARVVMGVSRGCHSSRKAQSRSAWKGSSFLPSCLTLQMCSPQFCQNCSTPSSCLSSSGWRLYWLCGSRTRRKVRSQQSSNLECSLSSAARKTVAGFTDLPGVSAKQNYFAHSSLPLSLAKLRITCLKICCACSSVRSKLSPLASQIRTNSRKLSCRYRGDSWWESRRSNAARRGERGSWERVCSSTCIWAPYCVTRKDFRYVYRVSLPYSISLLRPPILLTTFSASRRFSAPTMFSVFCGRTFCTVPRLGLSPIGSQFYLSVWQLILEAALLLTWVDCLWVIEGRCSDG